MNRKKNIICFIELDEKLTQKLHVIVIEMVVERSRTRELFTVKCYAKCLLNC